MLDYTKTWLAVRGITLFQDKRGVTALEYGMIAALIAAVIITILSTIGKNLVTEFTNVDNAL